MLLRMESLYNAKTVELQHRQSAILWRRQQYLGNPTEHSHIRDTEQECTCVMSVRGSGGLVGEIRWIESGRVCVSSTYDGRIHSSIKCILLSLCVRRLICYSSLQMIEIVVVILHRQICRMPPPSPKPKSQLGSITTAFHRLALNRSAMLISRCRLYRNEIHQTGFD